MPRQPDIPGLLVAMEKKVMRREQVVAEMEAVVRCSRRLAPVCGDQAWRRPHRGRDDILNFRNLPER
jgi:hypothetical protein